MTQLPLWGAPARARPSIKPLSKSRVAAGLQCHKRLYFECYHYNERDPIDPAREALFESGREVGRVARGRWPGGVTIEQNHFQHDEAVAATRAAMARPKTPAIYEAAFLHDDIRVRVDDLTRNGHSDWDLVEVKSSGSVKEDHLPDLAVQLMVAEGAGIPIGRAGILYINKQYVWDGGPYDLESLFRFQDLADDARSLYPRLREEIAAMREPLWAAEPPDIAVGPHCDAPYPCPFYQRCHVEHIEYPITSLPRLMPRLREELAAAGYRDIRDVPESLEGLSPLQRRVVRSVQTGAPFLDPALREELARARAPIHFLDFETCNPALPIVPGTRPFQQVPFQWSDHVLDARGTLRHHEYLHGDRTDPREPLARALLETLGREGTIVVYSDFEGRVLRELAEAFPSMRDDLLALAGDRMLDLHRVIQGHYYHPGFMGSFSIKQVLPAVVKDLSYDDLEIREGSQAALAYIQMTDPDARPDHRARLREGLLRYCQRDTMAMVRLYQTLREIS